MSKWIEVELTPQKAAAMWKQWVRLCVLEMQAAMDGDEDRAEAVFQERRGSYGHVKLSHLVSQKVPIYRTLINDARDMLLEEFEGYEECIDEALNRLEHDVAADVASGDLEIVR